MNKSNFRRVLQRLAATCVLIVPVFAYASLPAPTPDSSAPAERGVESEASGEVQERLAQCECPGGVDCRGNSIIGVCGQVVCGSNFRLWQCGAGGWAQIGTEGCTC